MDLQSRDRAARNAEYFASELSNYAHGPSPRLRYQRIPALGLCCGPGPLALQQGAPLRYRRRARDRCRDEVEFQARPSGRPLCVWLSLDVPLQFHPRFPPRSPPTGRGRSNAHRSISANRPRSRPSMVRQPKSHWYRLGTREIKALHDGAGHAFDAASLRL